MITNPAKELTDSLGRRKLKGNIGIELTIDAMEQLETADHLVIFVWRIHDGLHRQADHFFDLQLSAGLRFTFG